MISTCSLGMWLLRNCISKIWCTLMIMQSQIQTAVSLKKIMPLWSVVPRNILTPYPNLFLCTYTSVLKYINFKILLFLMCYHCYVCCDKHTKLSFHYLNRPANKMKINFYTGGSFFKKLAFYIVETFEQNNYCLKTL